MKRYIEEKEILVLFFTAYFFYGRNKYGHLERGDIRLARIAACRGVMHVCDVLKAGPKPLPRLQLDAAFAQLERQADRLADGTFKSAYLETLTALREKI